MKIEDGISGVDIKIVASADKGVAYWDAIDGALKMSERTGMPVELTHNAAKVIVDWQAAIKFFAEQLVEKRTKGPNGTAQS